MAKSRTARPRPKPTRPSRTVRGPGQAAHGAIDRADEETPPYLRRAWEWFEHNLRWRWLLDSYEGGDRYRRAIYGWDHRTLPVRNLIRHKREYPDPRETTGTAPYGGGSLPGQDPAVPATDDDYELRLARTPVPTFVKEAIDEHLSRVYQREVKRDGPAPLESWWGDVDGSGADVDCWMQQALAPPLLATGQVDVLMDHPPAPEGAAVRSQADVLGLGLDRCVASIILPQNMLWWRQDRAGRYLECLVREYPDGNDIPPPIVGPQGAITPPGAMNAYQATPQTDPTAMYRHWTKDGWTLYDAGGSKVGEGTHGFGRVPIVRLFAGRRKTRCRNVGQCDYEGIAEAMREAYNRSSELILSDTTQAHPLLQGPEDFVQADGTIPIGPSWLLPKKKNGNGSTYSYEGFDVVQFPKDGADSIRQNLYDLREQVDRDAALTKPAGSRGTSAGTVAQSGLSKSYDNDRLNNRLGAVADALARAERQLAELALTVLGDGGPSPADLDAVAVEYSKQFDLVQAEDLGETIARILEVAASPAAGLMPGVTAEFLGTMLRLKLPGRDDATYAAWDEEIEAALAEARELALNPPVPPALAHTAKQPATGAALSKTALKTPVTDAQAQGEGPAPAREPVSLGDLHDAMSLFDRHGPALKGLLDATKGG